VDTSAFAKGMSQMGKLTASFEQTIASLKGALAGIGVALGVHAFASWVQTAIRGGAETRRTAETVGMTSEAFQELAYAAKVAGLDQDLLANDLEKLNDRLAEVAISGSGPAAEALKRFGLSGQALAGMGTEQAFKTILGVIGGISNPMERAAVAMDAFGKSGQAILTLANRGPEFLKEMGLEASALGVAMNSVDTAKLAEANAGFTRIGEAIYGVANSIAVQLSPYITAVADQFVEWMKGGVKTGSYISQAVDWITTAIGGVADVVQVVQIGFYSFRSLVNEVFSVILQGIDKLIGGFGYLYEKITGTKLELTSFFADWSQLMDDASKKDIGTAMNMMGKDWAHNTVRALKDEIDVAAQKRAELSAKKQADLARPGAITAKVAATTFASGGAQLGTSEGYSAVVQSKARLLDSMTNQIVQNTAITAEATTRMATALAKTNLMNKDVDGVQYREAAGGK